VLLIILVFICLDVGRRFPLSKGRCVNHPPASGVEVKEKVNTHTHLYPLLGLHGLV